MFSFEKRALIYHVLFQLRCGTLSPDRRGAAFILAYCPCVITKEKKHDEAESPRKKDREPSEAEKTTEIQKEEEEVKRRRRTEKKKNTERGEREQEDFEKKKENREGRTEY